MPFDELVRTRRMEDPDEREVQDLKKSSKKYRSHIRRKSISTNSAAGILFILKLVAAAVLVVLCSVAVLLGIKTYTGSDSIIPSVSHTNSSSTPSHTNSTR
jgi:hypothetical protein